VAFGQFVGQFVLAIWTLNEPKQNLSFFLFNTKVGFGKKKKKMSMGQWVWLRVLRHQTLKTKKIQATKYFKNHNTT
jgi:hypothetical protein